MDLKERLEKLKEKYPHLTLKDYNQQLSSLTGIKGMLNNQKKSELKGKGKFFDFFEQNKESFLFYFDGVYIYDEFLIFWDSTPSGGIIEKYTMIMVPYSQINDLKIEEINEFYLGLTIEFKYEGHRSLNKKYKDLFNDIIETIRVYNKEEKESIEEEKRLEEQKQKQIETEKLDTSREIILKELDVKSDGELNVIEGNDFNLLLKKHQKKIIEIDRNYIQQFVKVSTYIKTKKNNIQLIFESVKNTPSLNDFEQYSGILKNEIHSYQLILFNSLNMVISLVEDDMITFYEIHDSFDKLNMFNTNWENEVSNKLTDIGDGLKDLMYSIDDMSNRIVNEIGNLTYVTQESNKVLSEQLQGIDSSLQVNNLLTGIQTYKQFKK